MRLTLPATSTPSLDPVPGHVTTRKRKRAPCTAFAAQCTCSRNERHGEPDVWNAEYTRRSGRVGQGCRRIGRMLRQQLMQTLPECLRQRRWHCDPDASCVAGLRGGCRCSCIGTAGTRGGGTRRRCCGIRFGSLALRAGDRRMGLVGGTGSVASGWPSAMHEVDVHASHKPSLAP